VIKAGVRSV
jgi:hypothetical protein